jgi:hypothetical protein
MPATPKADAFARYRTVGAAAALLILALGAKEVWQNFEHPGCRDFISFWSAGRFAIAGSPALAYNADALSHLQSSVVSCGAGNQMPFPYMPAFLLPLLPFALLPFAAAMALWVVATLALYLLAARRLVPGAGLLPLVFPPILVTIAVGQNGLLTAAFFFAAMASLDRRPFTAGAIAGCLIVKPQLGLLLPIAFIASREWRAVAGAAVTSMAITIFGLTLFGPAAFLAWAKQLPLYGAIARDGLVGWSELSSVYAAARQAGLGLGAAMALHLMVAGIAAAAVWFAWRSRQDRLAKAAVLASATALASPYLFLYDLPILALPLLWLARSKIHPALLAVPWCVSAIAIAQHFTNASGLNLNPLIGLSLLALTLWQQRKSLAPQTAAAQPLPA